jgi:type IV secretory pathway VirB10-like protein
VADGAAVGVTIQDAISSRTNTVGQHVNGVVSGDVMDAAGAVVIPSGSPVVLTIAVLGPAMNSGQKDGTIALQATSVTVGGTTYDLNATVGAVPHTLVGRGITKSAVENVAVGTAVGAVVGQAIGKNQKSTIIGGAVGAVAGGARAATVADRDVVVAAGTPITLTLTQSLTISSN